MKPQTLRLTPLADLQPFANDGNLVAVTVGADRLIYVIIALGSLDYRADTAGGVSFAKTKPDEPQTYRVVGLYEGEPIVDVHISQEQFNIHDVQPLPDNELLLACCRCCYRGPDNYEKNGRVYNSKGEFVRELLLGDGIASVQTTSDGLIWTSYFDEGVFGNFGWTQPVGASGLVAWDRIGNKVYEFEPASGLDSICDCYALNVESDESTWLYYYSEFPLVHLRSRKIEGHWAIPIRGSRAFAVSQRTVVFSGGYNDRDHYDIFELGPKHSITQTGTVTLASEQQTPLVAQQVFARGESFFLVSGSLVYGFDVQSAIAASRQH